MTAMVYYFNYKKCCLKQNNLITKAQFNEV